MNKQWLWLALSALSILAGSARASAQAFQVEADIAATSHFAFGPSVRGGVLLAQRLALETGVGFSRSLQTDDYRTEWSDFYVPLEAVYYFGDGEADAIVPSLRLGGGYGRAAWEYRPVESEPVVRSSTEDWSVRALAGLTWFASERFAVAFQYGGSYVLQKHTSGEHRDRMSRMGSEGRIGILARL